MAGLPARIPASVTPNARYSASVVACMEAQERGCAAVRRAHGPDSRELDLRIVMERPSYGRDRDGGYRMG